MISHTHIKHIRATDIALIVALIATIGGIVLSAHDSIAATPAVCGDTVLDVGEEECDDGNAWSGDGCSSTCRQEVCGNDILDPGEQCDGATPLPAGQHCDATCFIAFCGDGTVQADLGEQCDDGNALPDDGCDALCSREVDESFSSSTFSSSVTSSTMMNPAPLHPAADPVVQQVPPAPPIPAPVMRVLPVADQETLARILAILQSGGDLRAEDRATAAELAARLEHMLTEKRRTLFDTLRSFISTPLSADVVAGQRLDPARLTDTELLTIIQELQRVPRRSPAALQEAASTALRSVTSLPGPSLQLPDDFLARTPLEQFVTIASVKSAAEAEATDDPDASLRIVQQGVDRMRGLLPAVIASMPSVDADALTEVLDTMASAAASGPSQATTETLASATRRLLRIVQSGPTQAERDVPVTMGTAELHDAAPTLAERTSMEPPAPEQAEIWVRDLADEAPVRARKAFEQGTERDQAEAIRRLLSEDVAVQRLLQEGSDAAQRQFVLLQAAMDAVGTPAAGSLPCSASIEELLTCTDHALLSLEAPGEAQGFLARIIRRLRALLTFSFDV